MSAYTSSKIIFPHIMKTGGTTVVNFLQMFFNENEVLFEASTPNQLNAVTFKRTKEAKFIRGHYSSAITDTFGPHNGYSIIALLRHPVSRVISHYWHLMKAADIDPSFMFMRENNISLEEFIESPECRKFTSNYQVRAYGSDNLDNASVPINEQHLQAAKEFIDRCSVVGVTENLPDFIDDLSKHFGFFCLPSSFGKSRSYSSNLELSDDLKSKIESMNQLDLDLYDYVQKKASAQEVDSRRKTNPMTIDGSGNMRWYAGQPFFGAGWGALMRSDVRHLWSIKNSSTLKVQRNYSGRMLGFLSLLRFVSSDQEALLKVFVNNVEVELHRVHLKWRDGVYFHSVIPESDGDQIDLRFDLEKLVSFAEVNSGTTDRAKRGFALSEIVFSPLALPQGEQTQPQDEGGREGLVTLRKAPRST